MLAHSSARNVRSLIAAQSIGTLASVYPDTASSQLYDHPYTPRSAIKEGEDGFYTASSPNALPPPYLAGHAFALPEYYAPCFPNNGSLLLIMFRISQNARNILASTSTTPKNSLSNAYDEQVPIMSEERETAAEKIEWKMSGRATFVVQELPLSHSPVSRPRVSLVGNVTLLSDSWSTPSSSSSYPLPSAQENTEEEEALLDELASCYVKYHPDAKWWVPGKGVFHVSTTSISSCPFFHSWTSGVRTSQVHWY